MEKDEVKIPFLTNPRTNDDEDAEKDTRDERETKAVGVWCTAIASICVGIVLSSLVWLITWDIYLNRSSDKSCTPSNIPSTTHCGHDPITAKANGCTFQLWSYSWVPPECFDKDLHDDFLALRDEEDWHYYSDTETPWVQVPLESVLVGNRNDLHSTWGQHFWHCAFYQRKFFRIVDQHDEKRTPVLKMTNRDLDAEHSEHCQKWLANPSLYPWDEVRINLTVGYHQCS